VASAAEAAFSRGESTAELLARRVTQQILDGDLEPGTRLREESLAATYSVSRTPIREALLLLSGTGLVALERNRGARVLALTAADVAEIYQVRGVLEAEAAALAATRINDEQLDELDRSCDELAGLHDAAAARQLEADMAFHYAIAAIAGNAHLQGMIRQVCAVPEAYRSFMAYTSADMATAEAQHRAVAAALRAGHQKNAAQAMRGHVDWAGELAVTRLQPRLARE
jgi:DNA-binding GntR family transcriptional regulator